MKNLLRYNKHAEWQFFIHHSSFFIKQYDMKKQIITLMCATALLSSCHIYKAYDRPEDITAAGLYRDTTAVNDTLAADTANFGNLPWREVFTDPSVASTYRAGTRQ